MQAVSPKKLTLIELNEINFELVKKYTEVEKCLPNFTRLIEDNIIHTEAENRFENLEPWIQWSSVHLGKTFEDHGIFRLGDVTKSEDNQIFEILEDLGL